MNQYLYRLRSASGELLYVGVTVNMPLRMRQHRYRQPWWGQVTDINTERYGTRDEALQAEASAIVNEHPRFNKRGTR